MLIAMTYIRVKTFKGFRVLLSCLFYIFLALSYNCEDVSGRARHWREQK